MTVWREGARRFAAASVALGLIAVASACGGNGNGGVLPTTCIDFTAAQAPASGTVVARTAATGNSCTRAAVELLLTDVTDVFAASFDVVFDPGVVRFGGAATTGSFLGSDGAALELIEGGQAGRISVGISRLGVSDGVDFVGSQRLVTLFFDKLAGSGAAAQTFDDAEILGPETPPMTKPGVAWHGGTLMIR